MIGLGGEAEGGAISRRSHLLIRSLALASLVVSGACATASTPPVPMAVVDTWVVSGADSVPLRVEVAATLAQAERGLMDRSFLAPGSGLLFLFDAPRGEDEAFWMWRTRIPLDLAALDGEGRILAIVPMEPCEAGDPEDCPPYTPGVAHSAALEVNQGWFGRNGVEVGDLVRLPQGGS